MTDALKARIAASQARDQIRALSGHSRNPDDVRAAAELIKDFERFRGVDLSAIVEEILAGQRQGDAIARQALANGAIAAQAERCALSLGIRL